MRHVFPESADSDRSDLQLPRDELPGGGKEGEGVIWMLTIYAKNEEQTVPAHILRKIKEEIDG